MQRDRRTITRNRYYPSQEMHMRAALALRPVISEKSLMLYWLMTTPRSGSNYVMGEIWRALGGTVHPQEYFNKDIVERPSDFVPEEDQPVQSYIRYLTKKHALNGVLGIKILYSQIQLFTPYRDFMSTVTGHKILYLYRENVIKQGISFYIATKTQRWSSLAKGAAIDAADVPYSFAEISNCVARMEQHNTLLRRFFLVNGLSLCPSATRISSRTSTARPRARCAISVWTAERQGQPQHPAS